MGSGNKIAVWAITRNGVRLADRIRNGLQECHLYVTAGLKETAGPGCLTFQSLKAETARVFSEYDGHAFIMASGIVIRMIAPLIRNKTKDPAVLVLDDQGGFCVSLLSGHIGGGNRLAETVAGITGSVPVITTATDVNQVPAIDLFAIDRNLHIENPETIKIISMAMLNGEKIDLYDPLGLTDSHPEMQGYFHDIQHPPGPENRPGVLIDDRLTETGDQVLVLRPKTLAIGIGCNRNTRVREIRNFLKGTLEKNRLSMDSIHCLASVDIKQDEKGLLDLSVDQGLPIRFFTRDELNQVKNIQTPSTMVEKHIGVKSVCEAAAILASGRGRLILPKKTKGNVTLAVARTDSI